MSEFDKGLPSIRKIQSFIQDSQEVEVKLTTDDLLIGRLLWQDPNCICLVDQYEQPTLIWRHSLVYLKPKA
jgi:host factor-I protein